MIDFASRRPPRHLEAPRLRGFDPPRKIKFFPNQSALCGVLADVGQSEGVYRPYGLSSPCAHVWGVNHAPKLISLRDSRRGDSGFAPGSSRNRHKILKNEMRGSEFATVWRHREILGRPAARYLANFVFLSFLCFTHNRSQSDSKVTPE